MKKILICFLVLAISITAFSVCSVSAEEGAFYRFRPNFDFDSLNPSYLYQLRSSSGPTQEYVYDVMDGLTEIFSFYEVEPSDYDGDFATFEFYPTFGGSYLTGLVLPLGVSSLTSDGSSVLMSAEDTLYLEAGRFYVQIDTEMDAIVSARFTIRPVYNTTPDGVTSFSSVYASTDPIDIYISETSKGYFDYPTMYFNDTGYFDGGVLTPVYLCVEFVFSTAEHLDITILNIEAITSRLFYGSGTSPNNPIYPPADGGNVGNLDSAEQELINSQLQGLDNTSTVIGNADNIMVDLNTDLQLGAFVQALNPILDKITTISGFDALVNMSLALGIFASLLSLSASIIGAGDRRERMRKQRENRTNYLNRKSGNS